MKLASSLFSYLTTKHPEASRLFAEINKNAKVGRQTILKCCTFRESQVPATEEQYGHKRKEEENRREEKQSLREKNKLGSITTDIFLLKMRCTGITWEFIRNAHLRPHPNLKIQICISSLSRWFQQCTEKPLLGNPEEIQKHIFKFSLFLTTHLLPHGCCL